MLKPTITIALVVSIAMAGCTYPAASENTVEFDGTVERVDGQFRMSGDIRIEGTNARTLDDVAVVLYDENQTVIDRIRLGSLSSGSDSPHPDSLPVNITTDRPPTYVLVESPDLRADGVPSEAFRWNGEQYTNYWIESEGDRFPSN